MSNNDTMKVERFEIWMVSFKDSTAGEKIKPMLIVSNDVFNALGNAVTAVPLSRPSNRKAVPTHVPIAADGLRYLSIAKCENPKTIGKRFLKVKVATLTDARAKERVEQALIHHFGLGRYHHG